MIYTISRFLSFLLCKILLRLKANGGEFIPKQGAFILASNHVSNLDPIILGVASSRKLNYMAKDSLFNNYFFGRYLTCLNVFPVKRNRVDFRAIKEAIRRLRKGGPLVLFPEGSRQSEEVEPGIGFFVSKLNIPVVPAFIKGTDRALPKGSRFIKPTKVVVNFGKQIYIERRLPYQDTARLIMDNIRQLAC